MSLREKISRRDFLIGTVAATSAAILASGCGQIGEQIPQTDVPRTETIKDDEKLKMEAMKSSLPRDVDYEYVPAFDSKRPVVELNGFPLERGISAKEFIDKAPQYLNTLIFLLEQKQDNPDINPNLSFLPCFQLAPAESYFNPPTLLTLLGNLKRDIDQKWVVIDVQSEEQDKTGPFASTYTDYYVGTEKSINMNKTHIFFNNGALMENKYPSLQDDDDVQISNLNLLSVLCYEYANRMGRIGVLVSLKNGYFKEYKPQSEEDITQALALYQGVLLNKGFRSSMPQNYFMFSFNQAIAAAAGDKRGKVIGMERAESYNYKWYVASQNGDLKSMFNLTTSLTAGAAY